MQPLRSLSTFAAGLPALDQYHRTMSCADLDLDAQIRVARFISDLTLLPCIPIMYIKPPPAQASQASIAELQRQLAMEEESAPPENAFVPGFR